MTVDTLESIVRGWYPFVLVPSSETEPHGALIEYGPWDGDRDWRRAIGDGQIELRRWPMLTVFERLAFCAVDCQRFVPNPLAEDAKPRTPVVTRQEMDAWIEDTQRLARRLPYGAPITGQLMLAAESLSHAIAWPEAHFVSVPSSIDTVAFYEFRASIFLWALEQCRSRWNATELCRASTDARRTHQRDAAPNWPPETFWADVFARWDDPEHPLPESFRAPHEVRKRIARLDQRIRDGHRDDLMVAVLRDVMRHGPPLGEPGPVPQTVH